jgi:HD-like signal output (HDOD) protein
LPDAPLVPPPPITADKVSDATATNDGLAQVTADPSWGPVRVAAVIEHDTAVAANVLQLANSACFGVGHRISNVRDAVVYLGADTIESLTLTVEAFGKLGPRRIEGFSIEEFQRHAMLVAAITASILPVGRLQEEALTAGLLHGGAVGLIVDSVDEVLLVPADQIEPIPVSDNTLGQDIAKVGDRLSTLVDAELQSPRARSAGAR